MNKKAQVTIFIIVAVLIVAVAVGVFLFKDKIVSSELSSEMEPVYNSFLSCVEDETRVGISVLESSAGYIELPDFEAGSSYSPFGSQLNFLGNPIPYWYYVSGNNIQKEQVPSKAEMENQLANFISERILGCSFETYYAQGFSVLMGDPEVDVDVNGNNVAVDVDMDMTISKGNETAVVTSHAVSVNSNLGNLYSSAREIYEMEQEELFLEEYAVDTLRLYAPVDGVELTCAPLTWGADEVFSDLKSAIEINTLALRTSGGDYSLNNKYSEYFVIDSDADVLFINSANWSNYFEVAPAEGNVLIAEPVGNQQGLGVLGFCYVPYHFVYDVKYPVLIQVYSGDEIFQFPVAVVIDNNNPRESLDVEAGAVESPDICSYKNTEITVKTYDTNLNSVDADVSYECFGEVCEIGETSGGTLTTDFPQCGNGYVVASADGFDDAKYLFSTVEEGIAEVILDRIYNMKIDLKLESSDYSGDAIVSFVSDDLSQTIVYPETNEVELKEGQYEVQVYVYRNSSLKIDASTTQQCIEVPQSSIGGLFGLTEEQCFEITIPAQVVSNALSGGGTQNYYILESELKGADTIEINAEKLPTPTSLEQLQDNYVLFEEKGLDIEFG